MYFIVVLVVIYNCINYHLVIKEIKHQIAVVSQTSFVEGNLKKMSLKFKLYPMILIICYGLSIFQLFYNGLVEDNLALAAICGCLESLMGTFNTIIYGCTPIVISTVISTLLCQNDQTDKNSHFTLVIQDESKGTSLQDLTNTFN